MNEVFIIKQNNQLSELSYNITIESFNGTALMGERLDFRATAEIDETFTSSIQRIPVNFQIIPDSIPEGNETFTFRLRNNDPDTASFINFPPRATITIFDSDSECCITQASRGRHGRPQCMCSKCRCMEVE